MRAASILPILPLALLALAGLAPAADAPPALGTEDFVVVSGPASPRVAFALRREGQALRVVVDVGSFQADGGGTALSVGVAADTSVMLSGSDAKTVPGKGSTRYQFTVPAKALVAGEAGWRKLRLALAAQWAGGAEGQPRQRERFRHLGSAPSHAGLAESPQQWMAFDLDEYATLVADRRKRIAIAFEQPVEGKASVVVEDAAGRRVRNLIAGRPLGKGAQEIEWDGLDEEGRVVSPGTYRWRSVHHAGIKPVHLYSFNDQIGANHVTFTVAAANRELAFLSAPFTEGGVCVIAVGRNGEVVRTWNYPHGHGLQKVEIAVDDSTFYAVHDGTAWGDHVDRRKPDWTATYHMTLQRFDIASGKIREFDGGKKILRLVSTEVGPGSKDKRSDEVALRGMALVGGKLYVADGHAQLLLVFDPATGARLGELKLPQPGPMCSDGAAILAVSGTAIVRVDPATGKVTPVVAAGFPVRGLAVAGGEIFASDGASHTVRVFSTAGKPLRTLGKPGGAYVGAYDPQRLINPAGLVLSPDGRLYVAEAERWSPKRLMAFDPKSGKVVYEGFGPNSYSSPGAGIDPEDHTRWIGQNTLWSIDIPNRTATPKSVLIDERRDTVHYRFVRRDGRTFVIGLWGATTIYELVKDSVLKPLATIGEVHRFCMDRGEKVPAAFIAAFDAAYPKRVGKHLDKGPGMLWADRNGDGAMQADEFDFSTEVEQFGGAYWGHDFIDLTLRMPVRVKGRTRLMTLVPDGYGAGGAPRYPTLNQAAAAAIDIDLEHPNVETTVDRFGNLICNSDPQMRSFAPDGTLRWTYANRWTNVHGSHKAPLPQAGVLQGVLFFNGVAPLDEQGDVMAMNGNHGRAFLMTSDGLYLDEMFKDVRLGGSQDVYWIGGECFGGVMAKSKKDGRYYLQAGGNEYRIFRLDGLDGVKRAKGELVVRPDQVVAAERALARRAAQVAAPRIATIAALEKAPAIDGRDDDWPGEPTVRWDKSGRFPVAVRAGYDAGHLYLHYTVADPSPWLNQGSDWQALFKTGDSIDLQLATDPGANPARSGPAAGDLRVLIAPFAGSEIAVLYRHRLPGATDPVLFQSPWRSEKVDSVTRLTAARIAVAKAGDSYRVEAAIPLAALGLPKPAASGHGIDFGALFGDQAGTATGLRSYWSNQNTGLVNDVPGEIMLSPNLWGAARFVAVGKGGG